MDKDKPIKPKKIIKTTTKTVEKPQKSPAQLAKEERLKMQKLLEGRQKSALVKFLKSTRDSIVNSINDHGFFYRKNFRPKNLKSEIPENDFDIDGFIDRMEAEQSLETHYNPLKQRMNNIIDDTDIEIKNLPINILKNWFFDILNRSQPQKLFAVPDPDTDTKIGMQKSLIFHLIILVIILIPFDMIFKVKKPSKVKITIIQRGVQSGMGSTVMTDKSKKDAQAPTKDQDAMTTELAAIDAKTPDKKIDTTQQKTEPPKPQNQSDKLNKQDAKKLQENLALLEKSTKDVPVAKKLDDKKQPDKLAKPEPQKPTKTDSKPQNNQSSATTKNIDPDAKLGNENRAATVERNTIMDKFADAGSVNGITQGEKRGGIANERNIIAANFYKCWVATNVLNTMPKNISVDAVVYLDIDGNVSSYNIADKSYQTDYENMQYNKAKDSAVYAINTCNKVAGLDKTRYSVWKKVELNFKYSKLN